MVSSNNNYLGGKINFMKKLSFLLLISIPILFMSSCGSSDSSADVHASPESVVQAVFDAANSDDLSILSTLCDPEGESDKDVERICEAAENFHDEFVAFFKEGELNGDASVEDDKASVPVKFNNGDSDDIKCINRDGKWYLLGM